MGTSVQVIDLVASDIDNDSDDDEVIVLHTKPSSLGNKRSACPSSESIPNLPAKKQKVAASRDEVEVVIPGNETHGNSLSAAGRIPPIPLASAAKSELVRIVLDGNDPATITPGILDLKAPTTGESSSIQITQHLQQPDNWSCGYRNLQMLLSSMLPHLPAHHTFYQKVPYRSDRLVLPSLRQIQATFEDAWQDGFDQRGAQHFGRRLQGKKSWIGAVEVGSVLAYWGIDSSVLQFIRCQESRSLLPKFIKNYFSKHLGHEACPFCSQEQSKRPSVGSIQSANRLLEVAGSSLEFGIELECKCPVLPLYLQWDGHSVSVVGMHDAETALIFDPIKRCNTRTVSGKEEVVPTTLSLPTLLKKDTQVIMVTTFQKLTPSEQQSRKGESHVITAAEALVLRSLRL